MKVFAELILEPVCGTVDGVCILGICDSFKALGKVCGQWDGSVGGIWSVSSNAINGIGDDSLVMETVGIPHYCDYEVVESERPRREYKRVLRTKEANGFSNSSYDKENQQLTTFLVQIKGMGAP